MKILHTEASPGWGGQELRILSEAEGMRARGHQVIIAVQEGGGLVQPARKAGFLVYEISFQKTRLFQAFYQLLRIIRKHGIEIVNTHSSLDAWVGGIAGKVSGSRVIRTRHLSTPIRKGVNSRLLYNWLADYVVTTCQSVVEVIQEQARLPLHRCRSIPTGVNPEKLVCAPDEVRAFRESLGVKPEECLVGTLCVLRGWKGVSDLLHAAKLLEDVPNLKWVVVGSGASENHFHREHKELGLGERVFFTGHLASPSTALAAMDVFLLLSWANEGVSQASLQAAWLAKPLVTTTVGGLGEVCLEGKTGFQVPKRDPEAVALAVKRLAQDAALRKEFGERAKELVKQNFTLDHTLDQMEAIYAL
ncbi:MAG: D-inositol-3-phosphate glycosyltransferase [Chlamydiales bacterium]|nr:D-inositol-3-phosphate glycosyltransferase [Chlamydiales bacterium]